VLLLPRGPWREPLSALSRADLVVVTRRTATEAASRGALDAVRRHTAAPPVRAWLRADAWRDRGGRANAPAGPVFAVTAIANPGAFLANARNAGAAVEDGIAFPDHHAFTAGDVARIRSEAGGRTLVLTEKDAVKLEPLLPETDMRVLLQRVEIEDGAIDLEGALDAIA
jgi:tetraacyldisaccharide 4'-kinase